MARPFRCRLRVVGVAWWKWAMEELQWCCTRRAVHADLQHQLHCSRVVYAAWWSCTLERLHWGCDQRAVHAALQHQLHYLRANDEAL